MGRSSEYLALHPGRVFTKEQLYEAVFGLDAEGDSSAIAEHIKNIRGKLYGVVLFPIDNAGGEFWLPRRVVSATQAGSFSYPGGYFPAFAFYETKKQSLNLNFLTLFHHAGI